MYEALEGKRPLSPYDWKREFAPQPPRESKPKTKIYLPPIQRENVKFSSKLPRTSNGWYGRMQLEDGHNLVFDRQQWTKTPSTLQHDLIKLLKWPMDYYD